MNTIQQHAKGKLDEWERDDYLLSLFNRPGIVGIIADPHSGKSNLLYSIITRLKQRNRVKISAYGLKSDIPGIEPIHSVPELEGIRNSVIILDEFFSLFDVDDRKHKRAIENTLRLIFHNNNIVVLSGLCENYKKFLSAKLTAMIFMRSTISDLINGSKVKNVLMDYSGMERGQSLLSLEPSEAIVFDGRHYHKVNVPYYPEYDSKKGNVPIVVPKIVHKNSVQKRPENHAEEGFNLLFPNQ